MITPKIEQSLALLEAADRQKTEADNAASVARQKRDAAESAVIDAFVEAYEELPVEIRNKVRHRINRGAS